MNPTGRDALRHSEQETAMCLGGLLSALIILPQSFSLELRLRRPEPPYQSIPKGMPSVRTPRPRESKTTEESVIS